MAVFMRVFLHLKKLKIPAHFMKFFKQTILFLSLLAFISTQSMWYDRPIEQPIPIDTLLMAVMAVESNFDTMAYNEKENNNYTFWG